MLNLHSAAGLYGSVNASKWGIIFFWGGGEPIIEITETLGPGRPRKTTKMDDRKIPWSSTVVCRGELPKLGHRINTHGPECMCVERMFGMRVLKCDYSSTGVKVKVKVRCRRQPRGET